MLLLSLIGLYAKKGKERKNSEERTATKVRIARLERKGQPVKDGEKRKERTARK